MAPMLREAFHAVLVVVAWVAAGLALAHLLEVTIR